MDLLSNLLKTGQGVVQGAENAVGNLIHPAPVPVSPIPNPMPQTQAPPPPPPMSLANKVGQILGGFEQTVGNDANNAVAALGNSPIGKAIVNTQNFLESPQSIDLPQVPQQINNSVSLATPLSNMLGLTQPLHLDQIHPLEMARDIVNTPVSWAANSISDMLTNAGKAVSGQPLTTYQNLKSPTFRLGYNLESLVDPQSAKLLGIQNTPQQLLGNVAGSIEGPLSVYGGGKILGIGKNAAEQAGAQSLLQTIKQQAITGAKYSGIFGLLNGLATGRDLTLPGQMLQGAEQGVEGAITGAPFGAAMGTAGYTVGAMRNKLTDLLVGKYKMQPDQADQAVSQFARDELGRFVGKQPSFDIPNMAPGVKAPRKMSLAQQTRADVRTQLGKPGNEPIYYGDLRQAVGLPRSGNYEAGFIKADEFLPASKPNTQVGTSASKNKLIEEAKKYTYPKDLANDLYENQLTNGIKLTRQQRMDLHQFVQFANGDTEKLPDWLVKVHKEAQSVVRPDAEQLDKGLTPEEMEKYGKDLQTPQGQQEVVTQYQKALQNKQPLDQLLAQTAQETGAEPISGLKNPATAVKKVIEKRSEGRNYNPDDLNDLTRGRLVYPDKGTLYQGKDIFIQKAKQMGLTIAKESDFFKHPNDGYQGYHVDVVFPNGQHEEVQFHTEKSLAASLATHAFHEQYGDSKLPEPAEEVKSQLNHEIMDATNPQAKSVADTIMQQTAPQQAAAQQNAVQVALSGQSPIENTIIQKIKSGGMKSLNQNEKDYVMQHMNIEQIRELANNAPQGYFHDLESKTGQPATLPTEEQMHNDYLKQPTTEEPLDFEKQMDAFAQGSPEDFVSANSKGKLFDALTDTKLKTPPPTDTAQPGTAAVDPKYVAQQARLARSAAITQLKFRALNISNLQKAVLGKDPVQNELFRQAMEHPEALDYLASESKDPQAFTRLVQEYSNFTDWVVGQFKDQNIPLNAVQDYITHRVALNTPEEKQAFQDFINKNAKNFQSGFTKQRVFYSIDQLRAAGFHLKDQPTSQDTLDYAQSMAKQLGAQAFDNKINELRPNGAVAMKDTGTVPYNFQGNLFLQSNVPGNQGTFIDPEIQKEMHYYNQSAFANSALMAGKDIQVGSQTFHIPGVDQLNQIDKETKLALGGFHGLNTSLREAIHDPLSIPRATWNFISNDANNAFQQQAIKDGVIDYGAKVGVTFDTSGDVSANQTMLGTVKSLNPITLFNKRLFGNFISTFKINLTRQMMQKFPNIDGDKSDFAKAQAYASQINDLMGGLNYEAMGRNKTVQQAFRLIGLAPDFSEGTIRQLTTALNPTNYINSITRPAATFALKSVIGQVLIVGALAEIGQRLTTGSFSPSFQSFVQNNILEPNVPLPSQFTNPKSGTTQTAHFPTTEAGTMLSAIENPQHFLQARGSGIVSLLGSLASGTDYYGNPLVSPWSNQPDTLPNRVVSLLPNQLPIPVQQLLKLRQGTQTPATTALNTLGFRVGANPNDPKYQAEQLYFNTLAQVRSQLNPNDQALFDSLHPTKTLPDGTIVNTGLLTSDKLRILFQSPAVYNAEMKLRSVGSPPTDPNMAKAIQYQNNEIQILHNLGFNQDDINNWTALHQNKVGSNGQPLVDQNGTPIYQKGPIATAQNAMLYLNNPKLQEAEVALAQTDPQGSNPLWLIPQQQRSMILASEAVLPGQTNQFKKLLSSQSWYPGYLLAENQYYTNLQRLTTNTSSQAGSTQEPQPDSATEQALNNKQYSDPKVQAYFQALDAYNNQRLTQMGLPPVAGTTLGTNSGYSSGGLSAYVRRGIMRDQRDADKESETKIQSLLKSSVQPYHAIRVPSLGAGGLKIPRISLRSRTGHTLAKNTQSMSIGKMLAKRKSSSYKKPSQKKYHVQLA